MKDGNVLLLYKPFPGQAGATAPMVQVEAGA